MQKNSILSGLRPASVAVLLALSGAGSSSVLLPNFPNHCDILFPLPFAVLCAGLFMRSLRVALAIPLMLAVWLVSFWVANCCAMSPHSGLLPGCLGGFLGGWGLVFCAAICYRSLFAIQYLVIGAIVSSLAGIAFLPWVQRFDPNATRSVPISAFAVWEAAMGICLYFLCRRAQRGGDENRDFSESEANVPARSS